MGLLRRKRWSDGLRLMASKVLMVFATMLLCLWMISGARAAVMQITGVKPLVDSSGGSGVQILFSHELKEDNVLAEFQRNFLQLSIKGANAFPAQNAHINGQTIDKVFVYQYQPDLSRARVLFKSEAILVKDRVRWSIRGNALEVYVEEAGNTGVVTARSEAMLKPQSLATIASRKSEKPAARKSLAGFGRQDDRIKNVASANDRGNDAKALSSVEDQKLAQADEKLLKELLSPEGSIDPIAEVKKPANHEETKLFSQIENPANMANAKSSAGASNPVQKMLLGLASVLALMAALTFGFKRFVLQSRLGLGSQNRMIQVLGNHMIGPKKSLSVVRVGKHYMVLGITDHNINLLQNLDGAGLEKFLDEGSAGFDFVLGNNFKATEKQSLEEIEENVTKKQVPSNRGPSIRSLIKQRMEGFKPL